MTDLPTTLHGITIDYSRDSLFDSLGLERLKDSYMMEHEVSPQERFAYVSNAFASNPAHAQRLYDYSSKHWLSYSTPILAYGRNKRGLAISCFLSYLPDSSTGLVDTLSEVNWLSMMGGGVGVHVGIRAVDDKSVGIMPHMKTYDASSMAYKQGHTRRGSYAMYLDISHPDVIEFLEMRKPTGDQNTRCLNLHNAVNISDKFMQLIEKSMADPTVDDSWELIDPASKEVREVVSAKALWQKLLILRMETGEPYLNFIDTVNNALPDYQKKLGLSVKGSNLCLVGDTEIDIQLNDGTVSRIELAEFVGKFELGYLPGVKVRTAIGNDVSWALVTAAAATGSVTELYEIETPSGSIIRCTPEHKIYTQNRGFVEAQHLLESDELLEL